MAGMSPRAELRWKEIVMIGPFYSFFFRKSPIYTGIPLSDLQTYGLFVRVEFGPIIRHWDQRRRMKRIWLISNLQEEKKSSRLDNSIQPVSMEN